MDGAAAASTFGVLLQILFLDLLLSGDNALVIALACRKLPPAQARSAAWLGAAGAILFRLILTLMAGALMSLPFLQLLSALPLLVIALNLMLDEGPDADAAIPSGVAQGGMMAAASIIVISDAAMSLDNVVALAAVSGGKFWLLAFGLVCTIPMIVFGSFGFTRLMQAFPLLVDAGAALLGWVAGGMIVGDPLFASWVKIQAPALDVAVPLACAISCWCRAVSRETPRKPRRAFFRRRRFGLRRRRSLLRGRRPSRCRASRPISAARQDAGAKTGRGSERRQGRSRGGGGRRPLDVPGPGRVVRRLRPVPARRGDDPRLEQGTARQRHHFGGRQAVDRKSHLPVELQGFGLGVERVVAFRRAARALEGQGLAAPGAEIAFEPVLDLRAFARTREDVGDDRLMRRRRDPHAEAPFIGAGGQGAKKAENNGEGARTEGQGKVCLFFVWPASKNDRRELSAGMVNKNLRGAAGCGQAEKLRQWRKNNRLYAECAV